MPKINVIFRGWDQLYIALDEFHLKNQEFVNDVLFQLGNTLVTLIQNYSPVDTGAYSRSWRIMSQTNRSITVGTTADPRLFVILEFSGARPHRIDGNTILRFEIGGQEVFVRSVNHPGMKPQPHVRPAMNELKRMAKAIVYNAMGRHFTLMQREAAKFSDATIRARGTRNVGRSTVDTTANIGRGTKGKISAQLTSRKGFKKRIRIQGTRRVGTAEIFRPRP